MGFERGRTHVVVHVSSAGEVGSDVRGPLDVVHGASTAVLVRVETIVHRSGRGAVDVSDES